MNKKILGNFLQQDSFFHRINPILKILIFSLISVIVIFIPKLSTLLISAGVLVFFIVLSKINFKVFMGSLRPLVMILLWALLLQLLFSREGHLLFEFHFIKIYDFALINTLIALSRFFILIGVSSLLTLTTPVISITHALEDILKPLKKIGIPSEDFALILSIAIRFIPIFFQESQRIKNAQASKGWDIEEMDKIEKLKFYAHILIPLFNSALNRAEELSDAMEVKGYNLKREKTRLKEYKIAREDIYFVGVTSIYLLFLLMI